VPVRSLRAKRLLAARWVVVAAIGFVAVVLGSSGLSWLMPGALNSAHVFLEDCQSCHTTVAKGAFGWVHSAFAAAEPAEDSGRCVTCHLAGEQPLDPHGVARAALDAITERVAAHQPAGARQASSPVGGIVFPAIRGDGQALPCATCHVEHRGENAMLTELPQSACQTCHVVRFAAFTSGHPEFVSYPYERRSRIIFDHESHFTRHFPESAERPGAAARAPTICVDCHTPMSGGTLMATRPFGRSCSACHLDEIRGLDRAVGPRGIAFLTIPGLDVRTLRERGIDIGEWPAFAELPPTAMMKLLLSADPETKAALETSKALDLLDLRGASDAELVAVGRLAWAIKRLYRELTDVGGAMLYDRLGKETGEWPDDELLARLMASIPRDVLTAAERDWLPGLATELAEYAAGRRATTPTPTLADKSATAQSAPAMSLPGSKDTGDILAAPKDTGDILAAPKDTGDILAAPKDTGDILAAPKDTGDILAAPKDTGDILAAPASGGVVPAAPAGAAEPVAVRELPPAPEPFDAEEFMRLGGWYRQNFSILYHPSGHADAFVRAWIDFTARAYGTPGQAAAEPVFARLTSKDAQGRCVKCHSIDALADGRLTVNWQPNAAGASRGGFTQFTHEPHLRLSPQNGCLTCHEIERGAAFQTSFGGLNPQDFVSNFKPIERAVCAGCHTKAEAGESCVQCHNYHAAPIATPVMGTKVSASVSAR
jgi:hypothetical protein